MKEHSNSGKVAFFCAEYGVESRFPIYSGGLGIHGGDILKTSADLELPVVGVGLLYDNGYMRQKIVDGRQTHYPEYYNPHDFATLLEETITVPLEGSAVKVNIWRFNVIGQTGYSVPLLLLNSNHLDNRPEDRFITFNLYPTDEAQRIKQYAILGIGGVKALDKLGYNVDTYHLNDAHPSFMTAEIMDQQGNLERVREKTVFTTHTPVPEGNQYFDPALVWNILGEQYARHIEFPSHGKLNMAAHAVRFARYINAVSKKHRAVAQHMGEFRERGIDLDYITNGVHSLTWTGPEFRQLFDANVPGWRLNPMLLAKFDAPYHEIEKAHRSQKNVLIDYVDEKTGIKLDPDSITLRFSRRFTDYKRPDLLLSDIEMLKKAAGGELLQVTYAGKAHPADQRGQELIHFINQRAREISPSNIRIVFIPDYNMDNAALLVQGVDLGLSNPQRTQEASATSLFKEAHNAAPHLGIPDGAFIEMLERASKFPVGWPIGIENGDDPRRRNPVEDAEDARTLYATLSEIIKGEIPPESSLGAIVHTASHFNSTRMVREYAERAWGLGKQDKIHFEAMVSR